MKKRILATLMSLCLIVGLLPTAALAAGEPPAETTEPTEVVEQTESGGEISDGDETEGTPPTENGDPASDLEDSTTTEPGNDQAAQPGGEGGSEPADPVPVEPDAEPSEPTAPVEPAAENEIEDAAALADEEKSGNCGAEGNNITWELTQNNGDSGKPTYTLTLTGSGAMADYETQGTPWYSYRESITEIVLPEGLTRIGKSAFLQTAITDVTIPDTVTSIGQNAFWNCNTIETEIPASVTELGETAFFGTFKVTVAEDNPSYSAVGKIIYDKNQTKLIQASQDIEGVVSIPETVEEIGAYTFYGCSEVSGALVIPDSVRIIGNSAFYGTGITSLKLGANVQTIGNNAFQGCTSLANELTIPDSVQTIGDYAFAQTSDTGNKITAITLGSGVKSVGAYAFWGCSCVTSLKMNEGLESIGMWAFKGLSQLSGDLDIPSTVKTIGEGAFRDCTSLNGTLTMGGALKSVDGTPFGYDDNEADDFTKVVLRDGVEKIGENAFSAWASLSDVTIPDSITEIGASAFANCTALSTVSFGSGIKTIGNSAFTKTALSGELKLPAGLEEIGDYAFSYCTSITEVNIPDTVTKIGYAAFSYNTKTEKITIPYGDITYGGSSSGNEYVFTQYGDQSALKTVVLGSTPENVLPGTLFSGSWKNIEYLVLGSGVKKAGDYFFSEQANSNNFKGGLYPSTLEFGQGGSTYLGKKATMFTLTDKTQLTYNGTLQMMTFEKPQDGEDVSSKITYSSSDPEIASVDSTGKITAKSVSDTPVTISASYEGCVFAELDLTVTPAVLTYWNKDNEPQQNPGSVTYSVSDEHTNVNDVLTFKWSGSDEVVTLTEGEDIDYTYTVPTESGGLGQEATVDFLPMPVGTYSVKFNLKNPDYTFAGTDGGTTDTLTITVNVIAANMKRAYIAAVKPTETTFTYDGEEKLPATGILTAYKEDNTSSDVVDIGDFTVMVEGLNDTTFHGIAANIPAGTDLATYDGLELPKTPGAYVITVSAANDEYYIYKSQAFNIEKATVTIKADDKSVYVGDAMPEFTYTVTGLASGDSLSVAPTLTCNAADTSTADSYTITPSGGEVPDTSIYNSEIVYQTGTLTVSRRSSGGGGGSSSGSTGNVTGSGDDVNIDVSGGTVTVAQMEKAVDKADRGETITIEASNRASVSLPSSGLQDAADNNNDVTVELKNGEVTLSPEALSAVAEQAGTTVTLTVDPVDTDELNSRQQATVGDAPVFDLTLKSGGKTITDFDGGLVTVAIPYELPDGQDPAGVVVWFMDDNGNITACETMYDLRTKMVIFTTRHFSKYVIGYEAPMNFTDVPADAYYADAVKWAVAEGITNGTSDTAFGPDVSCTRAQMVTFLWRAAGSPEPTTANNPFTDVQSGAYYYDAVLWAVEQGITSGTSANTFAPDATVTRAQTVTFLWRQAGAPVVNYAMSFTDVDASAYYGEAVRWAVSEGITSGTSDSTFGPDMDCTRAQIVTFLYRAEQ